MEPRFNKPLYNEVLRITNDTPRPSNSKIYARCNKTSSQRKYFVSLFALGYIEVPVYNYFIFLSFALLYSIGFLPVVILNTRQIVAIAFCVSYFQSISTLLYLKLTFSYSTWTIKSINVLKISVLFKLPDCFITDKELM